MPRSTPTAQTHLVLIMWLFDVNTTIGACVIVSRNQSMNEGAATQNERPRSLIIIGLVGNFGKAEGLQVILVDVLNSPN